MTTQPTALPPPGTTHSPARPSPPDLTLRDIFAIGALHGMLANPEIDTLSPEEGAREAFKYADAMLGERGE